LARTRVLTTNPTGDSGLSALAAISRAGYEVSTADIATMALGWKSRFASAHHTLRKGTVEAQAESLVELVDRLRPDVFLPIGMRATRAATSVASDSQR
jgi:hypothetical protein